MKTAIVALVFGSVLCLASPASAQLASNEVYANTTFTLAADHDGLNTTEYRLLRNGVVVATQPRSALVGTTIRFSQPGLAVGSYVYRVDAVGDGGTGSSANFTVVVRAVPAAPGPPSGLRIER
jgi:hypothetical protein